MTAAAAPTDRSGLLQMAQAAFWFALMSLLVKLAGERMPTMQVVFGRGCVTLVLSAAMLLQARISPFRTRPGLLLLRGLFGSTALICFYAAVVHLPLAEATVIQQTSPLFTALLAAWLLQERLQARVLGSIALCLCGVILIARPAAVFGAGLAPDFPWQFAFVGVLGAVLSSFAYVTVRSLGRHHHPLVVVFYFPVVTVPLSAPFALTDWAPLDGAGLGLLIAIGVVTQFGQIALTKGLSRAPAGRATAVGYLQIAFAALLGIGAFGTMPDAASWSGIALIVGSLLIGVGPRRSRAPGAA